MTVSDDGTDASARCGGDGAELELAGESLSTGDLQTVINTASRRDVIRLLRDADGPVPVARVVEHLATKEHGVPVEELRPHQRQQLSASLRYYSLPRLDECGIVDYDPDADVVAPTAALSNIESHLIETTGESASREPFTDGGTVREADARLEDDANTDADADIDADAYRAGAAGATVAGIAAVTASPLAVSAVTLGAIVAVVLALAVVADRVRYATRPDARSR